MPKVIKKKTVKKTVSKPPAAGRLKNAPQPTSEQKKAGWKRRQQKIAIMNMIQEFNDMNLKDFKNLIIDIKDHPEKYTVMHSYLSKYVDKLGYNDKILIDYLDRHVSKAPTEVELSGKDGKPVKLQDVTSLLGNSIRKS